MLKNLSAGNPSIEECLEAVKERDEYIRAGKYTTLDGGITCFGTIVVVGENHKKASQWLYEKLNNTTNTSESVHFQVIAERNFDVQIWENTSIIAHAKNAQN